MSGRKVNSIQYVSARCVMETEDEFKKEYIEVTETLRILCNDLLKRHLPQSITYSLTIILIKVMKDHGVNKEKLVENFSQMTDFIYDSCEE
jgi:hypothetical protein